MPALDEQARQFIQELKAALNAAQRKLHQSNLKITKIDLELQTTTTKTVGGGLTIKVVSIEGHHTEDTQTIVLSLVPAASGLTLLSGLDEDLVEAIETIAVASAEAASTASSMDLTEATVRLEFGMTDDGKVQVVVEGSGARGRSHAATLTVAPLPG